MERIMLIMIVAVALVAIGGLLFVGVQQAPEIVPVFMEQPVMESTGVAPGTVLGQAGGQIKFQVAPITDSAGGQIKFSMK